MPGLLYVHWDANLVWSDGAAQRQVQTHCVAKGYTEILFLLSFFTLKLLGSLGSVCIFKPELLIFEKLWFVKHTTRNGVVIHVNTEKEKNPNKLKNKPINFWEKQFFDKFLALFLNKYLYSDLNWKQTKIWDIHFP